jgi:hypothetical protein
MTGLIIGRLPFTRIVKDICDEDMFVWLRGVKWQSSAMAALQHVAEAVLCMYFEMLYFLLSFLPNGLVIMQQYMRAGSRSCLKTPVSFVKLLGFGNLIHGLEKYFIVILFVFICLM